MKTDDTGRPPFRTFQERGTDIDTRRMLRKTSLDASQSDVAASRAINGTVYQNTSGKVMVVAISILSYVPQSIANAQSFIMNYCDSSNPPTTLITSTGVVSSNTVVLQVLQQYHSATFIVPQGYYYKVTSTTNGVGVTCTLNTWIEYAIY